MVAGDVSLGLLPQRLDAGVGFRNISFGGEVALQQPDTLTHHGFGLGFRHAGFHQFPYVHVGVEYECRLFHGSNIRSLCHFNIPGISEFDATPC